MSNETVQVTIQVPEAIDSFVRKLAALEGSTPEEWYKTWICGDFDSIRDNNFVLEDLDAEKMRALYHYDR
jgi:hypothetical protein